MKLFELSRADDPGQAIAAGATATTAQQGADIRFIAGGTTLIDLMKLNVEAPQKVVDVTHLPFAKIETLPDGGLKDETRRNDLPCLERPCPGDRLLHASSHLS